MINSRVGLKVNTVSHWRKVMDGIFFHLQGFFNKASRRLIFGNAMHIKWKLNGMYCVRHINQSQWSGVWVAGTVCLTLKLIVMAGDNMKNIPFILDKALQTGKLVKNKQNATIIRNTSKNIHPNKEHIVCCASWWKFIIYMRRATFFQISLVQV